MRTVGAGGAGAAAGLSGFLQMGVGAGASALTGAILAETQAPMAAVILACSTLALVSYGYILRANRRTAPAPAAQLAE